MNMHNHSYKCSTGTYSHMHILKLSFCVVGRPRSCSIAQLSLEFKNLLYLSPEVAEIMGIHCPLPSFMGYFGKSGITWVIISNSLLLVLNFTFTSHNLRHQMLSGAGSLGFCQCCG